MASPVTEIAGSYRRRRSRGENPAAVVHRLYGKYAGMTDTSLLDTASLVVALTAYLGKDRLDQDAITPQLRRAFGLAYPDIRIEEFYQNMKSLEPEQVSGHLDNLKGKFAEVVICDNMNAHEPMGTLTLRSGQVCRLADSINQPGYDLEIVNPDGTLDQVLQVKATAHVRAIKDALIRYPDIDVITTDEAADAMLHHMVHSSGLSNETLENQVRAPVDALLDDPVENVLEMLPLGLPGAVIIATEGGRVLFGRQSWQAAVQRSSERGIKTGAAQGAAFLATVSGVGLAAIPVATLVRIGVDRAFIARDVVKRLDVAIARIEPLRPHITSVA